MTQQFSIITQKTARVFTYGTLTEKTKNIFGEESKVALRILYGRK